MVTNEELIAAYRDTGSVWKAAKKVGLCGQSIHERLVRLGVPRTNNPWTADEIDELRRLSLEVPMYEAAMRLGRSYTGLALKASRLGLKFRSYSERRTSGKPKRGTGLNKATTAKAVDALLANGGKVTPFCKQHGYHTETFIKAAQFYAPETWQKYVEKHGVSTKKCEYCGNDFIALTGKQKTCSRKCGRHARKNKSYFNGRRQEAVGMAEKECQICMRSINKGLSAHHAYGVENDPEADFLVAICSGCHDIVGRLAATKASDNKSYFENLIAFALLRKHGAKRPMGYWVDVDIEEVEQDEE
jgi:hypothetical protein